MWTGVSPQVKTLIFHLLDRNAETRYSIEEVVRNSWVSGEAALVVAPRRVDTSRLVQYQKSIKFRRLVLNYMATQCSSDEIADMASIFLRLDTNQDGELSLAEIQAALSSSGVSRPELEEMIKSIDMDVSGNINFTEFLAAVMDRGIYMSQEKLWQAFKRFDLDDNGSITMKEIQTVLDQDFAARNPEYWRKLVEEVDRNGDGTIDFEEFMRMMEEEPLARFGEQSRSISL